ncbi:MAG: hypothetical protein N2Z80_02525 [Hydrogenothermaceae bacterium]|nr:hypothetical protein [Hydrogenothermaceae bacterium]
MGKYYYPDLETVKAQKELIRSKVALEEDKLLPSLDGRFSPYRYFKHNVSIQPSHGPQNRGVINETTFSKIREEGKLVPYTVPTERSYAIVELQDLTSERRITNLLYDAIYEGIPISDLKIGLEIVALRVIEAIKEGYKTIILSDLEVLPNRISLPLPFVLAFLESLLSENSIDHSELSMYIETQEVSNPFEIATLLSLGAKGVYNRSFEEDIVDLINSYIQDLLEKKGVSSLREFIGSKNVTIVGLKNDFLALLNPTLKSSFEVEGLVEIESYLFH